MYIYIYIYIPFFHFACFHVIIRPFFVHNLMMTLNINKVIIETLINEYYHLFFSSLLLLLLSAIFRNKFFFLQIFKVNMSPASTPSTIYDHLMINFQQQPKIFTRNTPISSNTSYDLSNKLHSSNLKSNFDNLLMTRKPKSTPLENDERMKRRYTITHVTIPEPIVQCSVSNQVYDKTLLKRPLKSANISSTSKEINSTCFESSLKNNNNNNATKPMDFRPLIKNGRRRFTTIASSSPMVIVKKKSPSPMNNGSLEQVCM